MPNHEVDNIVRDMNRMNTGSDFSGVARQIYNMRQHDPQHFRQNLAEINNRVDMRRLGFNEDFSIVDVDNAGSIRTVSQDGRTVQRRDRVHLEVQQRPNPDHPGTTVPDHVPNTPGTQRMGSRDYQVQPTDGSTTFTVRNENDTLWSISRDVMRARGQDPTDTTARNRLIEEIRQANGNVNPRHLQRGQVLNIPDTHHQGDMPAPQAPAADVHGPNLRQQGDIYRPVAPRGNAFNGSDQSDDPLVNHRNQIGEPVRIGDTVTTRYRGTMQDASLGTSSWRGTGYEIQRMTDSNNNLLESHTAYGGSINMRFDTGNGNNLQIERVRRVDTTYQASVGNYETTITTARGEQYRATSDRDGNVIGFRQVTQPNAAERALQRRVADTIQQEQEAAVMGLPM